MTRVTTQSENSTEARRQAIQAAFDATKPASERNRIGQFATPNALAVDIARYVASLINRTRAGLRFADPSIGTGSFFSAALAAFGSKRIRSAIGVELDPALANAARNLWSSAGLQVVQGDFTEIVASSACPSSPDLILANPPYVRHHHIERKDKERLQRLAQRMADVDVNGLAGLYVYFLLLATVWMADSGYAAWLIPSEFMDVNYGDSLKRFLAERVTLIRAHRFDPDDVQFGDALVSSVVLVFRKAFPPSNHRAEFTFGGTLAEPHASERISLEHLHNSRKWTVYPSHDKNDRRISDSGGGPTLGDFFRVQRGIATGCNKFFILDRADAKRRGLPSRYLRPILPSPRHMRTVVIDGDDDGYPLLGRQLCLLDCDIPEDAVRQLYPALWEYLQSANVLGIKSGYLINKRTPWYKQEQREPPLFLCTYMGRGAHDKPPFRFVLNRSKAVATNLYLMLYPKNSLATLLRKYPERTPEVHELLGQITAHELRGEGRVYGGGLHKIEPAELCRISAAPIVMRWPELNAGIERVKQAVLF